MFEILSQIYGCKETSSDALHAEKLPGAVLVYVSKILFPASLFKKGVAHVINLGEMVPDYSNGV